MRRIETRLVTAFEGKMAGDNHAVLEDTDFVGEDVDIEDATARGVRHAVEIAAEAHHPLMRDAPFELENRSVGRERQRFEIGFPGRRPRRPRAAWSRGPGDWRPCRASSGAEC